MAKYLDSDGVLYLWGKIKSLVTGAVPTKTSDLANDSGFITSADVPEGATASISTPLMDGTAAVGSSTAFARGDHVHPSDTAKQNVSDITFTDLTGDYAGLTTLSFGNGNSKTFVSDYGAGLFQERLDNSTVFSTVGDSDDQGNILDFELSDSLDTIHMLSADGIDQYYVSKETGKGLSTNDYTTAEKNKLAAFSAASNYALKSDITNMYKYKGSVATVSNLPSSGNTTGDVYNVEASGMNYAWNGSAWDALGEIFTITSITNAEIDTICT